MGAVLPLTVIMLMVLANALYVAAEFATVSARRSRLQELIEAGNASAKKLQSIIADRKNLDEYVAACQVGITLSSLIVGAYGQAQLAPILAPFFERLGNLQQAAAATTATLVLLVGMTALQVVLGELLPKTVALRYPERLAMITLPPMRFSLWLFRPLIQLYNGSAYAIMRKLKIQAETGHSHVHSPEELEMLFTESARGGLIDRDERNLLQGVFSLDDMNVREVMVPRVRMNALNVQQTVSSALDRARKTPHTRLPVYEGTPDRILGTVHVKDLYFAQQKNPQQPLGELVQKVLTLPDVLSVQDVWKQMKEHKQVMAILSDEYGGVSGLITREDIIEQLFGEVQDEFDHEEPLFQQDGEDMLVRGDASIHTVNQQLNLQLPDEDAYTISGLVWSELEHVPVKGETLEVAGVTLTVEAVEGKQVTRVRLHQSTESQEGEA